MTTQPISPADLASLSERERSFYIEHRDDPFYPTHYILTDDQATVLEDEENHGYVKVRLDRNDSVFYIHRANLELISE